MTDGNALYQRFVASKQEAVRLDLALQGFFMEDGITEQNRQAFGKYLKLRIRPAVQALIKTDDLTKLQQLEAMGWLNAGLVEDCLDAAIEMKKTEAFIWLLGLKTEKYGFRDRNFDL